MAALVPPPPAGGVTLRAIARAWPRAGLCLALALTPTQFYTFPVADFHVSPADVLVGVAFAGMVARAVRGSRAAAGSLRDHRYLALTLASYLVGFAVLGTFSRTIVRQLLWMSPSFLAAELLVTRRHLSWAAAALMVAGFVDAAYGAAYYLRGIAIYPGRFSGMAGVNLSAFIVFTGAAVGWARWGHTRAPWKLAIPGALTATGMLTLSQGGLLGFLTGSIVLRRAFSARNAKGVMSVVVVVAAIVWATADVPALVAWRHERFPGYDHVPRSSFDTRVLMLRAAWDAVQSSPLVGIGFFGFRAYSLTNPEIAASTAGVGYYPHNAYMGVLAEGGLLALAPALAHFALIAWRTRRGLWARIARDRDPVYLSAFVGLPVGLATALTLDVFSMYAFWGAAGLALAATKAAETDARGHGP
jgi:hypothetical protein